MRIAIVGAGFVGQATGRGLSKHQNDIVFIDVDKQKIEDLRSDNFEAYTPDKYSKITTDITMFCVPTPPSEESKPDLSYLETAVSDFALRLRSHKKYHLVVIRSTVLPGTARNFVLPIIEKVSRKKAGRHFGLVFQPEYLREANANEDFERPWLILYGALDNKSAGFMKGLYKPLDAPVEQAESLESAEIQKYVHNIYNAVKVAFFNEMRIAIRDQGLDAERIFLDTAQSSEGMWNPIYGTRDYGPFDGSCLPKDTLAFLHWAEANGYDFSILRTVFDQNLKHQKLLGQNKKVRTNHLTKIKVNLSGTGRSRHAYGGSSTGLTSWNPPLADSSTGAKAE